MKNSKICKDEIIWNPFNCDKLIRNKGCTAKDESCSYREECYENYARYMEELG